MQKFAAVVTYLRSGWHLVYAAAPVALVWYFVTSRWQLWFINDHFFMIWIFKHRMSFDELNQHIALGLLMALGAATLNSIAAFLAWILYTRQMDLEFTRSSVGALAIGSLFVGFSAVSGVYLGVPWFIFFALGVTLLYLETLRMRVLASTY